MFGILTLSKNIGKSIVHKLNGESLINKSTVNLLMTRFSSLDYSHRADTSKSDLGYGWIHYSLVRMIKPARVLCIGSRYGFIPAVLAQACKDNGRGHVDFVDAGYDSSSPNHWTGVGFWKTGKGKSVFKEFNLGKWITLYVMTTQNFSNKYKRLYDYIYIDGDHSYKGVSSDYKMFWPMLKAEGFMAFHDISVTGKKSEGEYGVAKLWKEISKRNAFSFNYSRSGLGVIQKH